MVVNFVNYCPRYNTYYIHKQRPQRASFCDATNTQRIKILPNDALKRVITISKLLIFSRSRPQQQQQSFICRKQKCCTTVVKYETDFLP